MLLALKQTQVLTAQLLEARHNQDGEGFRTLLQLPLNPKCEPEPGSDPGKFFSKPEVPVLVMKRGAIEQYFSTFMKKCYEYEGKRPRRMFGTEDGADPDPLQLYDETADQILSRWKIGFLSFQFFLFRKRYLGRGRSGPRIRRRLVLVVAYLLTRLGLDHNLFCVSQPASYRPVLLDWSEPRELLLDRVPAINRMKRRKRQLGSTGRAYQTRYISF